MDLDGSHIAISVGIYRAPGVHTSRTRHAAMTIDVKPLSARMEGFGIQDIRIVDTHADSRYARTGATGRTGVLNG